MIRRTLATALLTGVALTGLAQAAGAAPTHAAAVKSKPFEACGKGETAKTGKCVKNAKQKVSGTVRFASSTQVTGKAVNKTRGVINVVVGFSWKAGARTTARPAPCRSRPARHPGSVWPSPSTRRWCRR
ncbi:hypothetical protein [Actinomadura fibrosa]|uniref:Uncharacterized protein n=1 Tax=Actinomadura fibrosa TaxID=111802 RepID=A0ABW2XLY5_9ACTN|nr:hypothetical protein [Actinomadura fibrosa]